MQLKRVFPVTALLLVVLMGSCKKDDPTVSPAMTAVESINHPPFVQFARKKINLKSAGDFAILSETGITDVPQSAITGDIGASPITGAAILVSCAEVTGTIYSVNAAGPLPCRVTDATRLTTAIGDMQTAYNDAAGLINPNFVNLGAGNIGGKTLKPGLYNWTSAVNIPTDVTISGGANDVWIFQVAQTLKVNNAVKITLEGGAKPQNIFWVVAGTVTLGTASHFEGIILSKTAINLLTGASINGRLLAQTAVTLEMNAVNQPIVGSPGGDE